MIKLFLEFWPYIAGVAAVLVSVLASYFSGRKDGASKVKQKSLEKQAKQEAKGRDAVAKEKEATDGMSNDDIVDRMRKRGDRWGM